MDDIALQTLAEEMRDDARVVIDASQKAVERYTRGDAVGYESCAFQLTRLFNAFEQMALRVAKAFENNIDDEKGWYGVILRRLSLDISGVRPALIPSALQLSLSELRAFRHVVVHAYNLDFDSAKLELILK